MSGTSDYSTALPTAADFNKLSMRGPGDQPIYDIDPEFQSLVPTWNETEDPTEASQEVKDLLETEQWLLNTDFDISCKTCRSKTHADGLCVQNTAPYDPKFATCLENLPRNEQVARRKLMQGIPQGAPSCQYHKDKLAGQLKEIGKAYDPNAPVPADCAPPDL